MDLLQQTLTNIVPLNRALEPGVQARLDDLTKPRGSLGRLEELALRYCMVQDRVEPKLGQKRIVCFAADHGVAAEGVSAFPKEVTPQMVLNMLAGGAAINVLARHVGAELKVVDMGVAYSFGANAPGLLDFKIGQGTANLARGPAMSEADAVRALEVGIWLAHQAADEGVTMLGTGDMGIANTTSAAALACAYLGFSPDEAAGRGTGIDDARLQHKIAVLQMALEVNRQRLGSGLGILAALGGYEIAGICGLILGGVSRRVAVVVDGFISTAGAVAACALNPQVAPYLFFGHMSEERGHAAVLSKLGAKPILQLGMRLGEGTGAALAMQTIEAGVRIYGEMATFSSAGVSQKS